MNVDFIGVQGYRGSVLFDGKTELRMALANDRGEEASWRAYTNPKKSYSLTR